MVNFDWRERPFITVAEMDDHIALDSDTAQRYGKVIKAAEISNRDYKYRYQKLRKTNNMKPPPSSHIHIMLGFIVVRNLGTDQQYETWIPELVFEDLYQRGPHT